MNVVPAYGAGLVVRSEWAYQEGMGIEARHGLKDRVCALKRDTLALYLAARHPRTPWYAKALAAFLAAYLLSPIDLIPDFVPVLGYLDDLVVISLGVLVVRRLVPPDVMEECRTRATEAFAASRPVSKSAAAVVIVVWVVAVVLVGTLIARVIWR